MERNSDLTEKINNKKCLEHLREEKKKAG